MNKKTIIIAILLIGVGLGVYFYMGSDKATGEEQVAVEKGSQWNPYADSNMKLVTLSDMILSASQGVYVVKMTNTIQFNSKEDYYKFGGYESVKDGEKAAEESGHGGGEEHVTAMEIKINDTISSLMLNANEKQLMDKKMLKAYLVEGINAELGFEKPLIKDLFIENYVVQ